MRSSTWRTGAPIGSCCASRAASSSSGRRRAIAAANWSRQRRQATSSSSRSTPRTSRATAGTTTGPGGSRRSSPCAPISRPATTGRCISRGCSAYRKGTSVRTRPSRPYRRGSGIPPRRSGHWRTSCGSTATCSPLRARGAPRSGPAGNLTAGLRRCPPRRNRTFWCVSLPAILRPHEPSCYVDFGTLRIGRPSTHARRRSFWRLRSGTLPSASAGKPSAPLQSTIL